MLSGIDYAHSSEKQAFDRRAVHLIRPFALATRRALVYGGADDVEFNQTRIGKNGVPFEAHKLRTLQPDGMSPIDDRAAFFRRSGMDELIQYKNVLEGTMSVVARRPLMPVEYDEAFTDVPGYVVDEYLSIVVPTRPGMVSSFVIESHLGNIDDHAMRLKRLELDIQDVKDGSRQRDRELFLRAISYGLGNKMRRGDIRPRKAA
jgi:lipopolysaccharide/colanic/teichoic acid biosynthesis glycosyltransferase